MDETRQTPAPDKLSAIRSRRALPCPTTPSMSSSATTAKTGRSSVRSARPWRIAGCGCGWTSTRSSLETSGCTSSRSSSGELRRLRSSSAPLVWANGRTGDRSLHSTRTPSGRCRSSPSPLPGFPDGYEMPPFLKRFSWIDLRKNLPIAELERLAEKVRPRQTQSIQGFFSSAVHPQPPLPPSRRSPQGPGRRPPENRVRPWRAGSGHSDHPDPPRPRRDRKDAPGRRVRVALPGPLRLCLVRRGRDPGRAAFRSGRSDPARTARPLAFSVRGAGRGFRGRPAMAAGTLPVGADPRQRGHRETLPEQ